MNEVNPDALSQRLAQALKAAGMSARELAPLVHLHHSYITRILNGERRPSADRLQRIAEALNIEPSELLVHVGIKPSSVLPPPRDYFLRKLGATEEEADMLASVVQYLHNKTDKEKPSEHTERERHAGPD